jgi:hypothetical protein
MGLLDRFLKFQETFHDLRKGISLVSLTAAVALLSNGCFPSETLHKSSIFVILMTLTSIVGCVHAPMLLAQAQLFLNLTFLRIWFSLELVPLCLPLSHFPVAFSALSFVAFSLGDLLLLFQHSQEHPIVS